MKTQELTAIFTTVRLGCSYFMEGDIHTVLDSLTLVFTLWVIYMMRFKLKSTYMAELDTLPLSYVVKLLSLLCFENSSYFVLLCLHADKCIMF